MEWFLGYIKGLCVFTLMTTLILNIFPKSNYLKYIKLFAGFLLMVMVLQPLLKLTKYEFHLEDIVGDISYQNNKEIDNKESELESILYERMSENYENIRH